MNKTILHPYIPAMVNNVEEWLSQMSDKGLTLIYMNGWKFVFQDTQKSEKKEYFIYSGFDASTGFSYDFYRAKEKYGNNTALNKSNCCAFEVDPTKKDEKFKNYRFLRNNYYKKHYIKLFLATLCLAVASGILSIRDEIFIYFSCLSVVAFLYSVISFCIIRFNNKQ